MLCGTPDKGLYRGCEEPSRGGCDGLLEVFGKPTISVEPGDSPFDDPPAGQYFEALDLVGALYGVGLSQPLYRCGSLARRPAEGAVDAGRSGL